MGLLPLALAALLAACGFEPALVEGSPPGAGINVEPEPPTTQAEFFYRARLVDRLGPGVDAPLDLEYEVATVTTGQAISADRVTERFLVSGTATWRLKFGEEEWGSGTVTGDAGYSATGTTVATAAAERDAERRLMTILADRTVTAIIAALP